MFLLALDTLNLVTVRMLTSCGFLQWFLSAKKRRFFAKGLDLYLPMSEGLAFKMQAEILLV